VGGRELALESNARSLLAAGHIAAARDAFDDALAYAREQRDEPAMARCLASLDLIASERAAETGDELASSELAMRAIDALEAAGDDHGVMLAWSLRAMRLLRAGQLAAGEEIADKLVPLLERDALFWLSIELAVARARAGRVEQAEHAFANAFALTEPGSAERMLGAAEAMRVWLDAGRARDALAIGISVLDAPAHGARALHAEVLVLCAVALATSGELPEATRFAARAADFDTPGLTEARQRLVVARGDAGSGLRVK
jgi:tetratricopeptide (TPR) repeat protein